MEIRDFAACLLHGETLADKLCAPQCLTDDAPGPAMRVPRSPGRPARLGLGDWGTRERAPFPTVEGLKSPAARGIAMHYFANHELLAIELMGLVLLRFPGAPKAFRRSIAATILEEQQHLRLYLQRMEALGVGFGEVPVNDFFWRSLACVTDPLAFVAGMGLTFEQANLDFSLGFQESFAQAGDVESSDIMRRVYEDEVGHVRHGAAWLRAWKDPAHSDWEAYLHALPAPLTPSRAKGTRFFPQARAAAGLSPEYTVRLEAYARSKGRPPDIRYFNPGCDAPVPEGGKRPWLKSIESDFAPLFGLLGVPGDIALTPRPPTAAFAASLAQAGLPLADFRTAAPSPDRPRGLFIPWGWDEGARAEATRLCATELVPGIEAEPVTKSFGAALLKEWLASAEASRFVPMCCEIAVGSRCDSESEILAAVSAMSPHVAVVKAERCAAGQERQILRGMPTPEQGAWIRRTLQRQGAVQVEPWLAREIDLSVQIQVARGRDARVLGFTQFITTGRGQYVGALFSRRVEGISVEDMRFLRGQNGEGVPDTMAAVGRFVGHKLAERGYEGPAGIDAFLYRDPQSGDLRLKPICEVNARHTMGLVALALKKRIASGRIGLWLHLSRRDVEHCGGFAELAQLLREKYPLRFGPENCGRQWEAGHLWTTPPETAELVATLVLIGESLDELRAQCDALTLKLAHDRLPGSQLPTASHAGQPEGLGG